MEIEKMRKFFPNQLKLSYRFIIIFFIFIYLPSASAQEGETTPKLTLQECIKLALKTHPEMKITQAQLKEASGKYKEINANYFPKFSIGTSYSRLDYAPQFKVRYLGDSLNDYQTSLYLKQLIYDSGKTSRLKEWARKNIAVEEENLRVAQQDLIHSVTKEYYGLIFAYNMVNVKQEAVRQIEAHVDVANAMFTSGKVPKVDVLRAEVQLANVQQELSKAQNALLIASAQLNDLIGRDIDTPTPIDTQLGFEESAAALAVHEAEGMSLRGTKQSEELRGTKQTNLTARSRSYLESAFESNPQLRRIRESIGVTEAKIKAERAAYWPNINFKADYGYEWGDWPPKENIWHIGLAIDLPLWDGGITKARVNQAKATLERLKATEQLLVKQITLQVQRAYLSLKEAESRVSTTEKSIEQAKENLRIVEGSYKLGTGISRDVIDAQVALTQAQTNNIQALIDVQLAKADLERAIGAQITK